MDIDDLIAIAEKENASRKKTVIRCCTAAGCMSSRADAVKAGLDKAVKDAGLGDKVEVRGVGCMRLCCQGPLVGVDPTGAMYENVTPQDAASLVASTTGAPTAVRRGNPDHAFFRKQHS